MMDSISNFEHLARERSIELDLPLNSRPEPVNAVFTVLKTVFRYRWPIPRSGFHVSDFIAANYGRSKPVL